MGRAKTYISFVSLLTNKLTGEWYIGVVRLQMTNNERLLQNERIVIATSRLSPLGKVKKLKISGSKRNLAPKRVKAPYAKIFSPYICFLE